MSARADRRAPADPTWLRVARDVVAGVFLTALLCFAFVEELQVAWRRRRSGALSPASPPLKPRDVHVVHDAPMRPDREQDAPKLASATAALPAALRRENERVIGKVDYYVTHHSFHYERHRAVTADGFVLYLHRVRTPGTVTARPSAARPVIMQHGLFMDPGMFVVNEDESMAFSLAVEGFDVWLASNRAVVQEHVSLSPRDDAFWDWSVDELAQYDVPCIVDYVLGATGHAKAAWVGMSQGNAQAFMAFSANKELAQKISLFAAIAPVARIGELPTWTLKHISKFTPEMRDRYFGRGEFVPLLCLPAPFLPPSVFVHLAYPMFNYLFRWSDANWTKSRKAKYFQFTPRPQSVKLIGHWCEMAKTNRVQRYTGVHDVPGEAYPVETMQCPLALFHGSKDYLADCNALVSHLQAHNFTKLRSVHIIDGYEHLDLIWASDVESRVTRHLVKLLHSEPSWQPAEAPAA